MKILFFLFFLGLVNLSMSVQCTKNGFYCKDCTTFVLCAGNGQGGFTVIGEQQCQGNLQCDEDKTYYCGSACNAPQMVAATTTVATTTAAATTTIAPTTTPVAATTPAAKQTTAAAPTAPAKFSCKENGRFCEPSDSSKYYICYFSGGKFKKYDLTCPGTFKFQQVTKNSGYCNTANKVTGCP